MIRRQQKVKALMDPEQDARMVPAALVPLLAERRILMRIIKETPETREVREIPLVMDAPRAIKEEVITHD